jgi:hypothetical protein
MRSPLLKVSDWGRVAIILLIFGPVGARAQDSAEEPFGFLRQYADFSQSDISSLNQGNPVAKILPAENANEVAILGAIRVNTSAEVFLRKYRDITAFKKSKEVLQIGKFGNPPRREDIQALTIDADEVSTLKECAVGKCSMKLTAEMIELLRKSVDWSSPAAQQQTSEFFHQVLIQYIGNYRAKGNPALAVYADGAGVVALAEQFRSLVQASPYLKRYVPQLENALLNYPLGRLADSEEFIYWSKEEFGVKPVVSVTHVTIAKIGVLETAPIVAGSKQIYANHYFTTSLGLAAFFPAPSVRGKASGYLLYLNRSRIDVLKGFFNFFRRWVLNRRLRDGIEKNLLMTKQRLDN